METPKSPPPEQPSGFASPKPTASEEDVQMTDDVPASDPFEHHPQKLLPDAIRKAYPNGPPSRDLQATATFQARKNEILRTMTPQEMQKRYRDLAAEMVDKLEENERKDEEVREEIDKLTKSRELEIKVYQRLKAEK